MRLFFLIICLVFSIDNMSAQFTCGTADESHQHVDQKKLDSVKKRMQEKSLSKDSVAITFHIVNDAVDIEVIFAEIEQLNNYFSGSDIVFFACGSPRYINAAQKNNCVTL